MSDQYQVRNSGDTHFVTFTVVDWVDIFTRPVYKELIIESLKHCQKHKGLEIHGFCLMTNHLHLLIASTGTNTLPDIIRDFKKHTSKQIINLIKTESESRRDWLLYRFAFHAKYNTRIKDFKVWQDGYHGVQCDNAEILNQKLDYIHDNPVRAGIVAEPQHYLYSSAANYAGEQGLLEIVLVY